MATRIVNRARLALDSNCDRVGKAAFTLSENTAFEACFSNRINCVAISRSYVDVHGHGAENAGETKV